MPRIDLQTSAFPKKYGLKPTDDINPTWDEILWAAITIGRPNIHYVFQYGQPSLYEALFRISMIRMALEQALPDSWHTLRRTSAFKALDPTEKGAVNYFLGMVLCKVFASSRLDIPWLLHIDAFKNQLSVKFRKGRSRPDLVGANSTGLQWAAFECKGRASIPTADDRISAKKQAQRIRSVNGRRCVLRVASFTYFAGDTLRMISDDPEGDDSGEQLSAGDDQWKIYYAPVLGLFEDQARQSDGQRRTPSSSDEIDLKVNIHPKILDRLRAGRWAEAHRTCVQLRDALEKEGFRRDGLTVTAGDSWTARLALS